MDVRGGRWAGVALFLVMGLGGCYHYTPMHLDEVVPAQEIRTRVSLQQAEILEEIIPNRDTRVVEGRVAEILRETLYLDVAVSSEVRGTRVESLRQRVDIPFSSILEVESKQLSRGRTAALVVGGAFLLGSFVAIQVIDSGGEGSPPDGPGAPENRIPLPIPLWP